MAYYSVGILICLCPYFICWLAVVSDGNDTRNGYKGRYGLQPAHYEIIVPLKVTETGEFISHTIPHHYKRSYYGKRRQKDMGPDDMVHYIVPIAGEKHHLELLPSNNIASPGMVVEVQDNKGISHRDIHKLRNILCHYTGSVRGQEDSRAALSTCYGLSGYVRTKRGYFFIEPAADHNPLSGTEHPHLLYEREVDPPKLETNCETTGNLAQILSKRATSNNETEDSEGEPKPANASELHIEVLVVLDKTLLNYHKEIDVENYVLTVFNMAHDLYHDASLNTNINLAIVRMIRLEEEEHKLNLAVNKDAKKTLEFFRGWQNKMNPGDDTHPNHHDVAVLLTRVDICGDDNNCGLLGASVMGGICSPNEQAAICEDSGLSLGFVIAHEIAHTLAIPHDTPKESGCSATLPEGLSTVMNPSVNIRTVEWSSCSPKFLNLFIDQGFGKCLYDPPTDHNFGMPDILPGVMYGGDFQCRELLGPNAALCDTGIQCNNLICYVEDKGCIETHTAAAPGTNCGERKWCYRGKCLEEGQRPGAVDGGWSPWSEWSECSRSCGSGVASRERHCDKPAPAHGGKYCVGEHKNHKICNTEPCDVVQPSFRNVQCAEFNDWVYPEDNKLHTWKAYYMTDENPCILFCVNDEGDVASLRPRVIDGTKCVRGVRDICIDGLCKEIPCDLDLESNAVEDWCGVCRGDGTSCTLIVGEEFVMEGAGNNSRTKLLDLPEGSVNIKVEETEPSEAKIQVASKDGNTIFIEGNTMGVFNISGTKAWLGNIRTKQESLNLPGPISEEISIWIETLDNITIKYSYGKKETTKRTPNFNWDYLEWSKCSAQCGPGTEEAIPRCLEKTAGLVDDKYCEKQPKPKERVRPCEVAPCIPRWMIGDWQKCNCRKHKRVRVVKCVKPIGDGEGEADIIPDSECVRPKPKQKESCSCKNKAIKRLSRTGHKEVDVPAENYKFLIDKEKLQESQMLHKRSLCPLANVAMNETECDTNNKPLQPPQPQFSIVIDKEDPKDVKLTLHTEPPSDKPESDTKECPKSGTQELEGIEALEYLNKVQKDPSNNKMQI